MADLGSALASVLQVPGLQELLNQSITENRQVAPLRTAIQQQALNMLPNSAFGGGVSARPNVAAMGSANYTTPAQPGGGPSAATVLSLLAASLAGGGALAKALGAPGASNLARIINGLKGLNTGPGPWASGYKLPPDPSVPPALDPNYVPPGTVPRGGDFNFGVGGGTASGPNLDAFSFFNPTVLQNPANPNAAAFGGAPIGGPDQDVGGSARPRVQAY